MKKKVLTLAAVASVGLAAPCVLADGYNPDLDIVLDLGSFTLDSFANGGEPVVFTDTGAANVVGFSFEGDVTGISGSSSWASDMRLTFAVNGVEVYSIGGFSSSSDDDWDFGGSGSTNDGFYASGPHLPAKDDPFPGGVEWTLTFTNDWNSTSAATMNWSNVLLTVHRVPAPGALALLGLAGVVGVRRRRN